MMKHDIDVKLLILEYIAFFRKCLTFTNSRINHINGIVRSSITIIVELYGREAFFSNSSEKSHIRRQAIESISRGLLLCAVLEL